MAGEVYMNKWVDPSTGQPREVTSRLNSLLSSGQYRDVPADTIPSYLRGRINEDEAVAQITKTPFNPTSGPIVNGKAVGPGGVTPLPGLGTGFSAGGVNYGTQQTEANPATMTKDQFKAILSHGSDPANTPSGSLGTSTAYKVSKQISSLIPPSKQALSPDANAPFPGLSSTPPGFNELAEEKKLATAYGLDHLQNQAAFIDSQIEKIQSDLIAKQQDIQGQGISSRVMSKEASMATRQANAQLRDLRLQRSEVTRSISVANKGISMMMSAEKTDFANAKSMWEFEYTKNIAYYNSLDKESTAIDKQDKATLQNMLNMLGTGKTKIQDLSPDAQNTIDELIMKQYGSEFMGLQNELSSKTAIYRKSFVGPDGKKYLQSLYEGSDGSYSTEYTTPATAKAGAKTTTQQDAQVMSKGLASSVGTDGRVSPADWKAAMDAWVARGHSATSFASTFKNYTPGDFLK